MNTQAHEARKPLSLHYCLPFLSTRALLAPEYSHSKMLEGGIMCCPGNSSAPGALKDKEMVSTAFRDWDTGRVQHFTSVSQ